MLLKHLLSWLQEKQLLKKSLDYRLLLVTLYNPPEAEVKKDWKQEVAVSEQLFSVLAEFRMPVVMELAVHNFGEEINFYFAAQESEIDSLYQQIQSFWPNAVIERVDDYNVFHPTGGSLAANVLQSQEAILPIKSYDKLEEDALLPVLNIFSGLVKEGDGVALQAVFKKANPGVLKSFKNLLTALQKGSSFKEAAQKLRTGSVLKDVSRSFGGAFKSVKLTPETEQGAKQKEEKREIDSDLIELINRKISRPLLEVNLRIVSSSETEAKAKMILDQVSSTWPLFFEPRGNSLKTTILPLRQEQQGFYNFSFRHFRTDQKIVFNTQELASLLHLPTKKILDLPKVRKIKARTAPAPLNLPSEGIVLGESIYRGERKLVRMAREDRFRHIYIIGQTGTGKSTFLKNLTLQDLQNGEGLALIDPHGEYAEEMLGLIPDNRLNDVIYFNPADTAYPLGFNMLEYDRSMPEQRTFVANELLEIIGKMYNLAETGGPIFEQYFRNALFLLLQDPLINATILDVPRVFADADFRRELLDRCPDPMVVHFWKKEAEKAGGDFALSNVTPYVVSKLSPFISNDYIKPIVGQEKSSLDFKDILNNRKILIVNLSKGLLGETNAFFLGMMLTGKIFMHALGRAGIPEDQRKDFYLYIDEFQNITTKTITQILSEARKYRLSLNIAHQYIAQIQENGVKEAVFGNVGSLVSFRISTDDANYLKQYFAPVFSEADLMNIDNLNAYLKPLVGGRPAAPFNIFIPFPPRGSAEKRKQVEDLSRRKYARGRQEVLDEINKKYQQL